MGYDPCKGGATRGNTVIRIPKIPSLAPNNREVNRQPENGMAKFHGSKRCGNRSTYLDVESARKHGSIGENRTSNLMGHG